MSDLIEPEELSRARVEERIMEFQLQLKRMSRRRIELNYELSKVSENEAATAKAMAELEANLKK
jgi:hypothetical protein